MGSNTLKFIISISLGLILGLYVMVEVITARSGIGQLYLYLAVAAFLVGCFSPRPAMYVLAFCTIYIDVFKRLMIIGGLPTFTEVAYVQSIPPLLVAGTVVSLVISLAFSKDRIPRDSVVAFFVASLIALASVAGSLFSTGDRAGLGLVGTMVNQGFYAFMVFIVPLVFTSEESRRKYLHYFFVLIIPSMLYMFWQATFGYADYEYDYLSSGLTIEGKNLVESMAGELRCFSTFNGCGTATVIYSVFVLYCFVPLRPQNQKPTFLQRYAKIFFAPLLVMAAYYTISRSGWICGMASLVAYFMLGSRFRARTGVAMAVSGYFALVALAPWIISYGLLGEIEKRLGEMVLAVTNDPRAKRAIVLGTMGDRVQGWANLTQEPKIWQPFGFAAAGMDPQHATNGDFRWGHDAIIDTLIRFGYVPLVIALLTGAYLFYRLYCYMYSLPRSALSFKITRLCIALNFGILVGALSSGAQFRNFPQNFFFMLWIALPFASYQQSIRERKLVRLEEADDEFVRGYPDLVKAGN